MMSESAPQTSPGWSADVDGLGALTALGGILDTRCHQEAILMGSGRGIGSPSQRLTASAAHATDGELASECWKHARCQSRTHPLVLFSTSCHVDAIMSVGGGCESLDARESFKKV